MATEQDALYRAVCDYPDEDAPRLMFADAVEERGDPIRAAFIRTQIELARVPEHDPLWSRCRRDNPNAILGWSLTYPLPQLPPAFSWHGHRMRRGFSWQASVVDAAGFAANAPALFERAPIQALEFDATSGIGKWLPALIECPSLQRIRRLEFALTHFDRTEALLLSGSPFLANLRELSLSRNAITAEGLEALTTGSLFTNLVELQLEGAALPPSSLVDALAAAVPSSLRRLYITLSLLSAADATQLGDLPLFQGLETLDLSNNRIGPEGVRGLAKGLRANSLEVLKLAGTGLGLPGVQALARSRRLPSLRWLDLSSNRLGPKAVQALADSPLASNLRILDLSHNPIGDSGAEALASSPRITKIQELVLRGCRIGQRGLRALSRSPIGHAVRAG